MVTMWCVLSACSGLSSTSIINFVGGSEALSRQKSSGTPLFRKCESLFFLSIDFRTFLGDHAIDFSMLNHQPQVLSKWSSHLRAPMDNPTAHSSLQPISRCLTISLKCCQNGLHIFGPMDNPTAHSSLQSISRCFKMTDLGFAAQVLHINPRVLRED